MMSVIREENNAAYIIKKDYQSITSFLIKPSSGNIAGFPNYVHAPQIEKLWVTFKIVG